MGYEGASGDAPSSMGYDAAAGDALSSMGYDAASGDAPSSMGYDAAAGARPPRWVVWQTRFRYTPDVATVSNLRLGDSQTLWPTLLG